MRSNHSQISPEIKVNELSRPLSLSKTTSEQVQRRNAPRTTAIIGKERTKQREARRRSIDHILGNTAGRDERNREEIIRETLRQVKEIRHS